MHRRRIVAAALAMLPLMAAAPPPPRYSVAPVRSDWDGARVVGRRGSGAICAPAGAIAWRDVAPEPAAAADRIARTLKLADVDAANAGDEDAGEAPRYRIVARITDLRFDVCARHFGIVRVLGGGATRGRGRLAVSWTVHDRVAHTDATPRETTVDLTLNRADETPAEGVMEGLEESARRLAERLGIDAPA